MGREDEALADHAATVEAMRRVLGPTHPATADFAAWTRANCYIDPLPSDPLPGTPNGGRPAPASRASAVARDAWPPSPPATGRRQPRLRHARRSPEPQRLRPADPASGRTAAARRGRSADGEAGRPPTPKHGPAASSGGTAAEHGAPVPGRRRADRDHGPQQRAQRGSACGTRARVPGGAPRRSADRRSVAGVRGGDWGRGEEGVAEPGGGGFGGAPWRARARTSSGRRSRASAVGSDSVRSSARARPRPTRAGTWVGSSRSAAR
ncbi:hypothetical protein ACFQZC_13665 [Streptacidiphilus monticola]